MFNLAMRGTGTGFRRHVTGANSAEGIVFTGVEGKAKLCYTGSNAGEDKITGTVDSISATVIKTWVAKTSTTTTTTPAPTAKSGVEAFGAARLASSGTGCVASSSYLASVSGSLVASVTFSVNGHIVATVNKPNSHGRYTARIKVPTGCSERLKISVTFTAASKVHSTTLTRTLARCKPKPVAKPRFTG